MYPIPGREALIAPEAAAACHPDCPAWTRQGRPYSAGSVCVRLRSMVTAMATNLAEFTGAALGLHLVFWLSMWTSAPLAGLARAEIADT
jgi:hypothetical protein